MKWYLAALVQRPDSYSERLAAGVTIVEARTMGLAFHKRGFVDRAALGTNGAIGPKANLKPFAGLGFVVKDRIGEVIHGFNSSGAY